MTSKADLRNAETRRRLCFAGALGQGTHAAVNARWPGLTREHCFICEAETGRAGRGEDSIYDDADNGPYCEGCRDDHRHLFN